MIVNMSPQTTSKTNKYQVVLHGKFDFKISQDIILKKRDREILKSQFPKIPKSKFWLKSDS